jgi:hypothetical protein
MRRNGTEYDKVMAVTNYLSQFKYVLEGTYPPENKDAVEDFLTVQKAGNCTNFASAAVVLLRGAGIPARFCTGYIPHYVDKSRNTFVVLAKDYHAWPEIYFPGYGWIEFEVTPGSVANIVPDNTTNTLAGFSGASFNDFPLYFPVSPSLTQSSSTNPSSNLPPSRSSQAGLILLLIFLIIALIISLFMIWLRKNKRRDAISGIMARMYLISPLIGVPFRPYQTTQEYAMELSAKLPKHRREIEKLTQIYLISRYSHSKQVIITDIFLLNEYWRSLFWGMLKLIIFRS